MPDPPKDVPDDDDNDDVDRERFRLACTECGRLLDSKERNLKLETCLVCTDE
jgi:hypothetical protein